MAIMGQDKKVRDGRLTFILVRGIGAAFRLARRAGRDRADFLRTRRTSRCPIEPGDRAGGSRIHPFAPNGLSFRDPDPT